jgi:hypothetical protein
MNRLHNAAQHAVAPRWPCSFPFACTMGNVPTVSRALNTSGPEHAASHAVPTASDAPSVLARKARKKKKQKQGELEDISLLLSPHKPKTRYSDTERANFFRLHEEGYSVSEAATRAGIGVKAAHSMLSRYFAREGDASAHSGGIVPGSHFFPSWMHQRVIELQQSCPGAYASDIRQTLKTEYRELLSRPNVDPALLTPPRKPRAGGHAGRPHRKQLPALQPVTASFRPDLLPMPSYVLFAAPDSSSTSSAAPVVSDDYKIPDPAAIFGRSAAASTSSSSVLTSVLPAPSTPTPLTATAPPHSKESPPPSENADIDHSIPSLACINDWLRDANFVVSSPHVAPAKRNTPETLQMRQEMIETLLRLYALKTPKYIILIDEKSFLLTTSPKHVRLQKPVRSAIVQVSNQRGMPVAAPLAAPAWGAVQGEWLSDSPVTGGTVDLTASASASSPSSSVLPSSASSAPTAASASSSSSTLSSSSSAAPSHTKKRKGHSGGSQTLAIAAAASRERLWLSMTQWKHFDHSSFNMFLKCLLREVDAACGPNECTWFGLDAYSIHDDSKSLFIGSRHSFIHQPPESLPQYRRRYLGLPFGACPASYCSTRQCPQRFLPP